MSTQDRWITLGIIITILIHLVIWLIGYFTGKLSYLFSFLNLAFAISVIAYWVIKYIHVRQNVFGLTEIVVTIFELAVAVSAVYNILSSGYYKPFRIMQYIFFGIDVMVLTAALVFMLTFKMTRLF